MTIYLHHNDLPEDIRFGASVAVDTEAMGLKNHRDRLCLVQLSAGDGSAHLIQFERDQYSAPHLRAILADPKVLKIFHFARFDVAILKHYLGTSPNGVYCTKIASYLSRTYTDKHSLRELCKELLGIELNKQQQSTDWGQGTLSDDQKTYAASDVLYLHAIKAKLDVILERENRLDLAKKIMDFIPVRAELDLSGWMDIDIFAH